eukprot:4821126-Alexandrium_andersonii.AAC.1
MAGLLSRPSMQNGVGPSEPELRGPRNDLNIGHPSSPGVRSAPLCALSPTATTRSGPGMCNRSSSA